MKKRMFFIPVLLSFMLAACYPTGELDGGTPEYVPQQDAEGASAGTFGTAVDGTAQELKNVRLSLSCPAPPEGASEMDPAPHRWDADAVKSILLSGKDITDETALESDYTAGEMRHLYETSDQSWLSLESGYLRFEDGGCPNMYEYSILESMFYYYGAGMTDIFGEEGLEGFSEDEALGQAAGLAGRLGIGSCGEPFICPFHAGTVSRYFEENFSHMTKSDGSPYDVEWTRDEEAYLVVFPQEVEGCQYSMKETRLSAVVARSGIVRYEVENWRDEGAVGKDSKPVPVSSVDALNTLIDYYESLIMDSPVEICGCRFVMYKESETDANPVHYLPAWEFCIKEQASGMDFNMEEIHIDAFRGNIIRRDLE